MSINGELARIGAEELRRNAELAERSMEDMREQAEQAERTAKRLRQREWDYQAHRSNLLAAAKLLDEVDPNHIMTIVRIPSEQAEAGE